LHIRSEVGAAALLAIAAVGDDVAAGTIGEFRRPLRRPLGNLGRDIHPRVSRQAAGDTQRLEETLRNGVGLTAGEPLRAGRAVETLDRDHIGDAKAREGITHVAFADKAAQIGELSG